MVERPYQYIPTIAILLLIEKYKIFIENGNFKMQKDLDLMLEELDIRTNIKKQDEKQISIEEYLRSRKK